jgi:hypothetical protein
MAQRKSSYERLDNDSGYSEPESRPLTLSEPEEDEEYQTGSYERSVQEENVEEFSWLVYSVFTLLGMAMLWSWYVWILYHCCSTLGHAMLIHVRAGTCS